ncbi:hypothetical protein FRB94_006835 [Tulasnella sp. JGI-2019a]|nr:hypothetical protein FRB93_005056 [Tulasnella sp. JGI-2019a]KAG8998534.1 hypothetical protein FRB94_006835 [Tulasnella sp. JGI-2019a]KAG9031074.1 hypothetical protein FRB95_003185 [Tulasnella sp. JGI-2019a]
MSVQTFSHYTDWHQHVTPVSYPVVCRRIKFCHPGYLDADRRENVLLRLPAVDQLSPQQLSVTNSDFGVQFGVAITACRIIACSRDGFLTEGARNGTKVDTTWDLVLFADKYFFHVTNNLEGEPQFDGYTRYAVCPSFRD